MSNRLDIAAQIEPTYETFCMSLWHSAQISNLVRLLCPLEHTLAFPPTLEM